MLNVTISCDLCGKVCQPAELGLDGCLGCPEDVSDFTSDLILLAESEGWVEHRTDDNNDSMVRYICPECMIKVLKGGEKYKTSKKENQSEQ